MGDNDTVLPGDVGSSGQRLQVRLVLTIALQDVSLNAKIEVFCESMNEREREREREKEREKRK